jgi:hypothetical protein
MVWGEEVVELVVGGDTGEEADVDEKGAGGSEEEVERIKVVEELLKGEDSVVISGMRREDDGADSGVEVVICTAVVEIAVSPVIDPAPVEDSVFSPSTLAAICLSVHSTTTPLVLFIGIAKHAVPAAQTSITKLPAELQFPTLLAMQAIVPGGQGDEKLRVVKKEL